MDRGPLEPHARERNGHSGLAYRLASKDASRHRQTGHRHEVPRGPRRLHRDRMPRPCLHGRLRPRCLFRPYGRFPRRRVSGRGCPPAPHETAVRCPVGCRPACRRGAWRGLLNRSRASPYLFVHRCCGTRVSQAMLKQNGHPFGWPFHKEVRRCPTLPQGPPCSTIGAESLSFRVRNVTGRFPLAMAAETLLMYQSERRTCSPPHQHQKVWWLGVFVGSRPYIENHIVDASNLGLSYQPYNMYESSDYQVIGLLVPVSSMGL
ncbi:MAG: hypothetical protein QOD27_1123 [Microbacteriaceae bacterium]|nr:hypothetical protein [Microbacteriaceae bacterium]